MIDFDKLSTEELKAIQDGNFDALSTDTLKQLSSYQPQVHNPTPSIPQEQEGEDKYLNRFGDVITKLLPRYGNALTANLVNPVSAGISTGIAKGVQAFGGAPEKSWGDTYSQIRERQNERATEYQKNNPEDAVIADIAGILTPGGAASRLAIGGQKLAKGITYLDKLPFLQRLLGAGMGNAAFGQLLEKGDSNIEDRLKRGGLDFGLGAGAEGLGMIAEKLPAAARKVGGRIYESILKRPKAEISQELSRGSTLGQELYDKGLVGTTKNLIGKADEGIDASEESLQNILKNAGDQPINKGTVADELNNLKEFYAKIPGREADAQKVEELMKKSWTSGEMNASDANDIKRAIYKLRQKSYGKDVIPVQAESEMSMARGIKKAIEGISPEVKGINQDLATYGKMKDALQNLEASGQKSNIIKLAQLLGIGGVGAGVGFGTGDPTKGLMAAAGMLGAGTPLGKTASAQTMGWLANILARGAPLARSAAPLTTFFTSEK